MPYQWKSDANDNQTLTLWPHQSLQPRGFVLFMAATCGMLTLPLLALLGTSLLWTLLPFLALAVAGMWFALNRNQRDARILEVLTLTHDEVRLERHSPRQNTRTWSCNRYWAQPCLHNRDGPVPYYVTLKGSGREVEIGAFLSEDERRMLFDDLSRILPAKSG